MCSRGAQMTWHEGYFTWLPIPPANPECGTLGWDDITTRCLGENSPYPDLPPGMAPPTELESRAIWTCPHLCFEQELSGRRATTSGSLSILSRQRVAHSGTRKIAIHLTRSASGIAWSGILLFRKEASGSRLFGALPHKPLVTGSNPVAATSLNQSTPSGQTTWMPLVGGAMGDIGDWDLLR
jgi:hypothetical protein